MIAAQSLRFITNKAIIVWTSNSSFIPLDSGFRRNDGKEQALKFVSPAKAGVQSRGLKRAVTQINDVYPIMDSLVILGSLEALKLLTEHQVKIYIITNQAGIAKGYITLDQFHHLTHHMMNRFKNEGIKIEKVLVC